MEDIRPCRTSVLPRWRLVVDVHVVVCAYFDRVLLQTISTLSGHSKKITGVVLHPSVDAVISTSLDSTVRVWGNQGGMHPGCCRWPC